LGEWGGVLRSYEKKLSICAIKKKIIFYIFLHIKIIMGQKEGSYWGQNDALAI